MRPSRILPLSARNGFSLVEVAIAIGLTAFALLAVFALLPVGFTSIKSSSDRRAAASALRTIQARVLAAPAVFTDGRYVVKLPGVAGGQWEIGGGVAGPWRIGLNEGGHFETSSEQQSMAAIVTITPPGSLVQAGVANIKIAWPALAQWTTQGWTNAQGSTEASFHFVPRSP